MLWLYFSFLSSRRDRHLVIGIREGHWNLSGSILCICLPWLYINHRLHAWESLAKWLSREPVSGWTDLPSIELKCFPDVSRSFSSIKNFQNNSKVYSICYGHQEGRQLWYIPQASFSSCCSVAQSCLTLCDPMNCSTPGFPVHHHFSEFAQTQVHWVGDVTQPSHTLSPSSPALNLSQYQNHFQWVCSSH